MGKTKKQLEQIVLKNRQYRSSQGKTPEQRSTSAKMFLFSLIGMILVLGYLAFISNLNL
jgi:K+-transporting ATPase A subunit